MNREYWKVTVLKSDAVWIWNDAYMGCANNKMHLWKEWILYISRYLYHRRVLDKANAREPSCVLIFWIWGHCFDHFTRKTIFIGKFLIFYGPNARDTRLSQGMFLSRERDRKKLRLSFSWFFFSISMFLMFYTFDLCLNDCFPCCQLTEKFKEERELHRLPIIITKYLIKNHNFKYIKC